MEGSKRSRCTGETWNRNPGRGEDESATDRNATKSSLADADVDNQVIEQIKLVGIVCYSSHRFPALFNASPFRIESFLFPPKHPHFQLKIRSRSFR